MEPAYVYLASGSPRRRELLAQIGVSFRPVAVSVDETPREAEPAPGYVVRLAIAKAEAGWLAASPRGAPVLGADTAVVLDGRILGKPADRDDAVRMLGELSGRAHQVLTAVAVRAPHGTGWRLSQSEVRLRRVERAEREAYAASGEPLDKAGGYAIQGFGAVFIEGLSGSYSGVVGLPLFETAALLAQAGVPCWGAP